MRMTRLCFLLALLLIAVGTVGCSGVDEGGQDTEVLDLDGQSLGTVRFPTSCDAAAQAHLERGLALLHNMTYLQAEGAFAEAAEADLECSLAYWGQAMTYAHPLWPNSTSKDDLAAGRKLLDRATSANHSSTREQAYVATARAYYQDGLGSKAERLAGFLDGWASVHRDNPDDPEAKLFHALALMATAPASDKTYEKQKVSGLMAEEVLAEIPRHPGAHHYIIHAYDFPPLAEKALQVARSYDEVCPENAHALHMTSHIFTRLGLWAESITFNIRAAEAARKRVAGGRLSGHHLHALDYLAYAYLQSADDKAALRVLEEMRALEPPYVDNTATAYAFAAVPVRYALERQDWQAAAAMTPRWPEGLSWDRYPQLVAIPVFSRALGSAHVGDGEAARRSIDELARLQDQAAALDMPYDWGIQVGIQKTAAEAWLAYEEGAKDQALKLIRLAAEMESSTEKNPVTPGEVLPAHELYGDLLLEMGRYDEAKQKYEAVLERSPNRFNSLFGAGRAAELAGDDTTAISYYQKLLAICPKPSGKRPRLDHARNGLP